MNEHAAGLARGDVLALLAGQERVRARALDLRARSSRAACEQLLAERRQRVGGERRVRRVDLRADLPARHGVRGQVALHERLQLLPVRGLRRPCGGGSAASGAPARVARSQPRQREPPDAHGPRSSLAARRGRAAGAVRCARWRSRDADRERLRRAIALAAKGRFRVEPNPLVGCVLGRTAAWSGRAGTTASAGPHAEVRALALGGRGGARGDGLRLARALQPTREDAALHGRARSRGGGARGVRRGATPTRRGRAQRRRCCAPAA